VYRRTRQEASVALASVPRVCVVGPESTGKTTLARELAEHFNTVCVPDYGRIYSADKQAVSASAWWPEEFLHIARTQARFEEEAVRGARGLLVCDTDAFSVWVWHRFYTPRPVASVRAVSDANPADLYLLLAADVPFVADGLRDAELERERMYETYRRELKGTGRTYVEISGSHDERFAHAVAAIEDLLGH